MKEIAQEFGEWTKELSSFVNDNKKWDKYFAEGVCISQLKTEYLPEPKELEDKLEKIVSLFSYNSDDFATAFAAYMVCFIRGNLGDNKKAFIEIFDDSIERLVSDEFEDSEHLKNFLKDFASAVCNNDYNQMMEIYQSYDYSIVSLYIFCRLMFQYYNSYQEKNTKSEETFEQLLELYSKMDQDMLDYALGINDYEINYEATYRGIGAEGRFWPYCCFESSAEIQRFAAKQNIMEIRKNLNFSENEKFDFPTFFDRVLEYIRSLQENSALSADEKNFQRYLYIDLQFNSLIDNILNCLAAYPWFEGKIERNMDIVKYNNLLHIPVFVYRVNETNKLLDYNIKLRKAQEEKSALVNDFSHRYKNMQTNLLFDVANKLINESETISPLDIRNNGITVLFESEIKQRLTFEANMLNLRFKKHMGMLQAEIQKSVKNSAEKSYSISDIINNAIKRCMITLIHDISDDAADAIIDTYFSDYDFDSLEKSFDSDVLFKKDCDAVKWLNNNNIIRLNVTISDGWKKVFFAKYQYADNIITDLLVDLIMNALKYADKNQPVFINLTEKDKFMIIKSQNSIFNTSNMPGSHQGLKNQNLLFNSINNSTDSITYQRDNDKFTIEIKINKQLFGG